MCFSILLTEFISYCLVVINYTSVFLRLSLLQQIVCDTSTLHVLPQHVCFQNKYLAVTGGDWCSLRTCLPASAFSA